MSSTQHQLIEQCATRLRGIVEALDNIHDTSPHRWSTDLDDVHSSAESLLAMIKDQAPPSEDQLIAAGLSYPLAKEDAVKLWYAGFRSEVVTVLEAWEAIGHDTGINPDKEELLESLRNMAAICNAHGNDMPAQSAIDQRQVIADAITGALAFGAQASQPPAEDHWLRPFYDIGRAEGQRTQDLAMLVRMLASSLKRHAPDSNLVARATNYLAAKGLAGTPLRDAPASVEQAGGDERAAFELFVRKHCGMPAHIAVNWDAKFTNDAWAGWQARAALAQPSPALPPFAEKVLAKLRRFYDCASDFESGGVDIGRHWFDLLTQLGLLNRVQRSPALWEISQQGEDLLGMPQPSPAQAEAERPEVVARVVHSNPVVLGQCGPLNANDELMTVAQHAASVARWAEMFNRVEQERDAALARVAELERGKVYVEARQCDECQHGGINDSATGVAACHECDWTGPEPEEDRCPGCQRENCMAAACPQCGARYVLVASEEIAAPVAQAQRSVPEEFSFEYRHPNGECHTVTVSREQVINEMPDFLFEALCSKFCNCEPVGETNVVECCCDEYAEEFKLIASAPGKEGV
ncbi:hypothetical protein [Pseudomonas aeruginosa]|uniref:hypothetical protein n=4 Tax=Pseudomonas aeruginosa TaxID=287 RepID=UPI0015E3523E|nr:hypothetical protein [Pseudomonas aeruginosa]